MLVAAANVLLEVHLHGILNFGRRCIQLVFKAAVMTGRDNWWHSYLIVRGEILGFIKDELLRKHLPIMFSLIKN